MTTETLPNPTPPAQPPAPPPVVAQPPNPAPPVNPPVVQNPPPAGIPPADHAAALAKARKDEKDKLYPDLEKARTEAKEAAERATAFETKLTETQQEVSDLREGKSTEMASVNRELADTQEKIGKLEEALGAVADDAATRILASETNAYREKAISEAGLTDFAEFVTGTTQEEINASVEAAKEKQTKIMEAATAKAREELGARVPKPLAGGGGSAGDTPGSNNVMDRQRIAKLKGPDFTKARAELIQRAREKAGLV